MVPSPCPWGWVEVLFTNELTQVTPGTSREGDPRTFPVHSRIIHGFTSGVTRRRVVEIAEESPKDRRGCI